MAQQPQHRPRRSQSGVLAEEVGRYPWLRNLRGSRPLVVDLTCQMYEGHDCTQRDMTLAEGCLGLRKMGCTKARKKRAAHPPRQFALRVMSPAANSWHVWLCTCRPFGDSNVSVASHNVFWRIFVSQCATFGAKYFGKSGAKILISGWQRNS